MRVWIIRPGHERHLPGEWPDDVACFELGASMIVYIQSDGGWDVCDARDGLPTASMWDEHGEPIE